MGTVRDISWKEGQDPSKDLPEAIMVQFDNYRGPFFAEDADGSGFVPIFPSTMLQHAGRKCCSEPDTSFFFPAVFVMEAK